MNTDLTGKLLIAMPSIGDDRFSRSVILLCSHSPEYAMGIVVNKPMEGVTLPDLLEHLDVPLEISVPDSCVLDGGPVSGERGFVLHSDDIMSEDSTLAIGKGLCMTASRDMLLALGSEYAPEKSVLALGYAGWGAGQLENELVENAWLVGEPNHDLIFGDTYDDKWNQALAGIGVSSGHLGIDPGRA